MSSLRPIPAMSELDHWSREAFERALGTLFEGAPRFVARLAADRPYGTDEQLLERARTIAHTMPEDEQVELLDAHPRIGAPKGGLSPLSFREQGHDRPEQPGTDVGALQVQLDRLNAAYEERFGFRFVVFVDGRPRSVIADILAERLHADRADELRRGLDDVIDIAADRLARSRGGPPGGLAA